MAVKGLNRLSAPNATTPANTPEQEAEIIETVPTREEARGFGDHTLRFKRNLEKMRRIAESRDKKINTAIDQLDRTTQKLMEANARAIQSFGQTTKPNPRRHNH